jgi:hypothetical protein
LREKKKAQNTAESGGAAGCDGVGKMGPEGVLSGRHPSIEHILYKESTLYARKMGTEVPGSLPPVPTDLLRARRPIPFLRHLLECVLYR